jgi:ABC-type sugar transport system substrate-binding protein
MLRLRWVAFLLVAVAAVGALSACGSSKSSSSSSSSASAGGASSGKPELASFEKLVKEKEAPITKWPSTAPTEPVKITPNKLVIDIALSPQEPASLATAEGVTEAAKRVGWRTKILYGEFSAAKTAAAFEQAIALGANAVVAQGIEPSQYKSSIKKLHEAHALFVSTYSDEGTSTGGDGEVSEHSAPSGELAAAKAIVDSGGKGEFVQFNFPEYLVLNNRTKGAEKVFKECSGCKILSTVNTASAEAEKTLPTATSTLLQQHPQLTAFLTGIDTFVTQYQMPVVRQQSSKVGVYTYLGGKPTLEALKKGEIKAVVVDPLVWGGWEAVDSVARLFAGKKPNGDGMAQRLLTKANVEEASKTLAHNGFWDADGFNYKGEFEKLWGLKK